MDRFNEDGIVIGNVSHADVSIHPHSESRKCLIKTIEHDDCYHVNEKPQSVVRFFYDRIDEKRDLMIVFRDLRYGRTFSYSEQEFSVLCDALSEEPLNRDFDNYAGPGPYNFAYFKSLEKISRETEGLEPAEDVIVPVVKQRKSYTIVIDYAKRLGCY